MSTKSPSMIVRWHAIPDKPSSPVGRHRPDAASKLAIWTFCLLRSFPPQAVGW